MIALAGSVLVASLLGSAHCAGMCGGFVCFFASDGGPGRPRARWSAHAAYHLGRLASYLALGLLAGALGAGVTHAAALAGVARGATLVAGALMAAWGAARLLPALGVRGPGGPGPAGPATSGLLARALRSVAGRPPAERAFVLGLTTTLLPCGWLFAFAATAAGTGRPESGALVMAVFWLGTVPALAAVGAATRLALGPFGRRLPALTAALVLVLGLFTLAGRMAPRAPSAPPAAGTAHAAAATPPVVPDPAAPHDCCD